MMEFSNAFGERISNFLDYRTARGYKKETYLRHLIKFDLWCIENHPAQTELSRELVLDWINDATISGYNIAQRVASMRQFARYLCAVGEEAYILPEKYTPLKSRAAAYLFTDMELTALFSAIDQLPPTKKEPFLNEMAPTLYRLIYTCGLRPNEGRELLAENINFETGEILITHTKRNKERFVVMSDDMLALARRYEQRRRIFFCKNLNKLKKVPFKKSDTTVAVDYMSMAAITAIKVFAGVSFGCCFSDRFTFVLFYNPW